MRTQLMRRGLAMLALVLVGCDGGAKDEVQLGYRGLGEEQVVDRSQYAALRAANRAPAPLPAAGPSVPGQWQNVQVLTDISANEMTRTMQAMTEWVAPKQGCAYCHVTTNFAVDSPSTKVVARQMLRMVRDLNTNWRVHVKQTGVTCYTCHRGNPVPPAGLWHLTDRNQVERALHRPGGRARAVVHREPTSLNRSSIKQTENTYALMIKMSTGLGVNCTYCHNSRSWETWNQGPPARLTAQAGLRHGAPHQLGTRRPVEQRPRGGTPWAPRRRAKAPVQHVPPGRQPAAVRRLPRGLVSGAVGSSRTVERARFPVTPRRKA